MVLRSVGYRACRCRAAVRRAQPHDPARRRSRAGPDGKPLPREYVAGWIKRGPTGVIGTNKSDAAQTVRALLADLCPGGARAGDPADPGALAALLAAPRGGAGELHRLAQGGTGRGGARRVAGPRAAGEAGQPRGHRRAVPRRLLTALLAQGSDSLEPPGRRWRLAGEPAGPIARAGPGERTPWDRRVCAGTDRVSRK